MQSLNAYALLMRAAQLTDEEHSKISSREISKKIDEIKYLTRKKGSNKLEIEKEIIYLEQKLQHLLSLERKLKSQKTQEKRKITLLKKEIKLLKTRLAKVEHKDIHKKVDHLTHVLGESLAKKEIEKDVGIETELTKQAKRARAPKYKGKLSQDKIDRVHIISERIKILYEELAVREKLSQDEKKIASVKAEIKSLEEKLKAYYEKHPEAMMIVQRTVMVNENNTPSEEDLQVSHNMMFSFEQEKPEVEPKTEPSALDLQAEEELPLPPPPRVSAK